MCCHQTIDHVQEMLQMLAVLTKDNRFEEYANTQAKEREKITITITMIEMMDRMIDEGYNGASASAEM